MRIALQTGTISPHQMPLAREIVKRIGAENYRYVFSQELSQDRKSIGWSAANESWCISAGTPGAREWVETCDVLVTSFRDCDLIERRAKRSLRTWYCNERWFKPIVLGGESRWRWTAEVSGFLRMLVPGFRRMAKRFVGLVNGYEGVGILAIGPWAKRDFLRLGVREEKVVDWGYFVEAGRGKWEEGRDGQSRGSGLRILWAGRDIPLKRVKDIERAVVLANASQHFNSSTFQPFNFTKLTGVKAEEVRKAMREHDVFVFASNALEGWGAVVNEALEEGMRVIGTFEAGASAAMLPKERLYHAGDVKALAQLLEKEFRSELPPCSIGEWTAEKGAERLLGRSKTSTGRAGRFISSGAESRQVRQAAFRPCLAGLRIIACLGVVSLHFGGGGFGRKLAVPLFLLMSFYLGARVLSEGTPADLCKRLTRLLLPFFVWGGLAIAYGALTADVTWRQVLEQLAFGRTAGLCGGHLYYLEVCAMLSAVVFCIRSKFRNCILVLLLVLAFLAQYAGWNHAWCGAMPFEAPNTIGRVLEFLPYACAGLLLAKVGDAQLAKRPCLVAGTTAGAMILYALTARFVPRGFGYQGAPLLLLGVSLFALLAICADARIKGRCLWLRPVSLLCAGAYFSHMLIGAVVMSVTGLKSSFGLSLVVFAIAMLVSWTIGKVPGLRMVVK